MNEKVLYLEITAENCIVKAEINGFPFYSLNAKYKTYFASPMNIGLIKGKNNVVINILPISLADLSNSESQEIIQANAKIKEYENGSISAPELGDIITEQMIIGYGIYPISFNNDTSIDFSYFFNSLEKIEDTIDLEQYIKSIIGNVRAKNIESLKQEFSYKLEQYALAYYCDMILYKENAYEFLTTNILENLPKDYREQSEKVIYLPYCDKKIWYCYLSNMEELIYSAQDEDENIHFIPVYVALSNGKLMIVR